MIQFKWLQDDDLWEWAQSRVLRGGKHGLVGTQAFYESHSSLDYTTGNWPIVAHCRSAAINQSKRSKNPVDLHRLQSYISNWENEVEETTVRLRFAGREEDRDEFFQDEDEDDEEGGDDEVCPGYVRYYLYGMS